ncbi:MAG: hypothetical protein P1P76_09260 [Anaerolineales bacterium]|nr:hypothetical protein [Anaerolineales bacterium]
MAQLLVLVIHDLSKVDEVVHYWVEQGVSGMTLIDTRGWTQHVDRSDYRDDLPLFPSLRKLVESTEDINRMVMSVVPDTFDVDELVSRTEEILGPLRDPETGILFVLPVSNVYGLQPGREAGPADDFPPVA